MADDYDAKLAAHHAAEERRAAEARQRYEQGKAATIVKAQADALRITLANTRTDILGGYAEAGALISRLAELSARMDAYTGAQ